MTTVKAQTWWKSLLPSTGKQLQILTPSEQALQRIQQRLKAVQQQHHKRRKEEQRLRTALREERKRINEQSNAWQGELQGLQGVLGKTKAYQQLASSVKQLHTRFQRSSHQLSVLYETQAQVRLTLLHVLGLYLSERKTRYQRLQKQYTESRYKALLTLQREYKQRVERYVRRLSMLRSRYERLLQQNQRNQKALTRLRKQLFAPLPSVTLPPTTRPTSRPSTQKTGQDSLLHLQQAWSEQVRTQRSLAFKVSFLTARLLYQRETLNKLEQELFQWKLAKARFVLTQIKRYARRLRSKRKGGLLHRVPALWWTQNLWSPTWQRTQSLCRDIALLAKIFPGDVARELRSFRKQHGYSLWWWELGLLLCLLPVLWWGRKEALALATRFENRARKYEQTRQLWLTIRLFFMVLSSLMPVLAILSLVLLFFLAMNLPYEIEEALLFVALLALGLQVAWASANKLFSQDPELRLVRSLDDRSTRQFRIIFKFLVLIALVYRPLFWTFQGLEYPPSFLAIWELAFYGLVLICTLMLFLNKDAILSLVPTNSVLGRLLVLFLENLYPLVLLLMLALFGIFVWGYHNLAGYLFVGIISTLTLGLLTYLVSEWFSLLTLWCLGLAEDEEGILAVEPTWGTRLHRSLQFLIVTGLSVVALFLTLRAWGLTQGLATLWKLLCFPFLRLDNAQISVLSMLQFGGACLLTVWLARWARKRAQQFIYPLFHLTEGRIYAYNTLISYFLYTVGILASLQLMGVGLSGVLFLAGVLGIGVGFGVKNIVNSFVAGIVVTFGKTVAMGDLVEINGIVGRVIRLTGRSITLETYEHRLVIIPNEAIMTQQVINWTKGQPFVRLHLLVGVSHGSDIEEVRRSMFQVAYDHPSVLKSPAPFVMLDDLDAHHLKFSLWVSVFDAFERFRVLSELRIALEEKFRSLGITIAFSQHDIHLSSELEEALVDNLRSSTRALFPPRKPSLPPESPELQEPPQPKEPATLEPRQQPEDGVRTGNLPKGTEIRRAAPTPSEEVIEKEAEESEEVAAEDEEKAKESTSTTKDETA
jgi:small-conductance mechanosensitive channel